MTASTGHRRLQLPPDVGSPGAARRWLSAELSGGAPEEVVDAAVLLLSEAVTNSLLHARTDIIVGMEWLPDVVRLEVADMSSARPVPKRYGADSATGRGLLLIEALADAWGVDTVAGGKVVWFQLANRRTPCR